MVYYTRLRALPRRVRRALQRQWRLPLAGVALMLALGQSPGLAATIPVSASCTLVDAITAANTDTATGGCPAGSGADTIVLPAGSTQTLTSIDNDTYGPTGLPVISSVITIAGQGSTVARASDAPAFRLLAVNSLGELTLQETIVSGGVLSEEDVPYRHRSGGGMANFGGILTVANSTIAGNSTSFGGGGVRNRYGGTLTLAHTLVSGNTGSTGSEISNRYDGTVVADNHNLFGVDGSAGVEGFTPGPTDVVSPAGVLLPDILDPTLAFHGGPTQTHALVPGSPAIDASGPVCLDATGAPLITDQRGEPRPVDGDGDGTPACDIGAFELHPPGPPGLTVDIDIKPGSNRNPINPKSHGVIPVALLTTDTFDATTVDPLSVTFGPGKATEAHGKGTSRM